MKKDTEIEIIDFLKKEIPEIVSIYIYGSFANNTSNSESDIDIGFLTNGKISSLKKWEIQEKLAADLDKDVDLVDLKDASVILKTEVIENGKLIYTSDSYKTDYFEMTTYSMYADLNESRMDILNDFKEKYGRDSDK